MSANILTIAKNYLTALEKGQTSTELALFFDSAVTQIEFPNRFTPNGATRNMAELFAASERGKKVLRSQTYEIKNEFVQDNTVIFEILWIGVLAVVVGTLKAGDKMKAHFATFLKFKEGKILEQRNYDCFELF